MAISFLQFADNINNAGAASISVSFPSPISAGSIIVVDVVCDPTPTSITVSDDKSDASTDSGLGIFNDTPTFTKSCVVAFLTATAGAKTITATFSPSSTNYQGIQIWEIAGLTGAEFDKVVVAAGTAATADSGPTGTLSAANEAAIGCGIPVSVFSAAGSGWTQDIIDGNGVLGEHQVVSSNASIDATGTQAGGAWVMWCATFMSGGAPPPSGQTPSLTLTGVGGF